MNDVLAQRVLNHPKFIDMAKKKSRLGWAFSVLMFMVYFTFIALIGLNPEAFATPVAKGATTTWGIYVGLFVIVFAFVITGVYVYKANGEYEHMTQNVIKDIEKAGEA